MGLWLTKQEFQQGDAASVGVTLNVAFMRDIKQDSPSMRERQRQLCQSLADGNTDARSAAEQLAGFRDEIETYFALEEFYGYFRNAAVSHPGISASANDLKSEHEQLFLMLNGIIEMAEQIVYHECPPESKTMEDICNQFQKFVDQFEVHEQNEMELMMRLCNEEIGEGD